MRFEELMYAQLCSHLSQIQSARGRFKFSVGAQLNSFTNRCRYSAQLHDVTEMLKKDFG